MAPIRPVSVRRQCRPNLGDISFHAGARVIDLTSFVTNTLPGRVARPVSIRCTPPHETLRIAHARVPRLHRLGIAFRRCIHVQMRTRPLPKSAFIDGISLARSSAHRGASAQCRSVRRRRFLGSSGRLLSSVFCLTYRNPGHQEFALAVRGYSGRRRLRVRGAIHKVGGIESVTLDVRR